MTGYDTDLLVVGGGPGGAPRVQILSGKFIAAGGGSMAQFELGRNQISKAVTHRTVEEIWFFLKGRGQMWRKEADEASIVDLHPEYAELVPADLRGHGS